MRIRSLPIRPALAVAMATIALTISGVASAHARDDASWECTRQFDRFLDDHPWVARDLQRDPTLANDWRYLQDHRSLREFLENHPALRRELRHDPYAVLRRRHRLERERRGGREITRDDLARFDRFLRDHPGVAHDLRGDPGLVNSRRYLADHPSFRDFLRDHDAIRQEMQDNPFAFMRRREQHRDPRHGRPAQPR
jgi:hypothetical protein